MSLEYFPLFFLGLKILSLKSYFFERFNIFFESLEQNKYLFFSFIRLAALKLNSTNGKLFNKRVFLFLRPVLPGWNYN